MSTTIARGIIWGFQLSRTTVFIHLKRAIIMQILPQQGSYHANPAPIVGLRAGFRFPAQAIVADLNLGALPMHVLNRSEF